MGIDVGGPVGTPCMAFFDGIISHYGYNSEPGDYGFVVITKHIISGKNIWALYGLPVAGRVSSRLVRDGVPGGVPGLHGDHVE